VLTASTTLAADVLCPANHNAPALLLDGDGITLDGAGFLVQAGRGPAIQVASGRNDVIVTGTVAAGNDEDCVVVEGGTNVSVIGNDLADCDTGVSVEGTLGVVAIEGNGFLRNSTAIRIVDVDAPTLSGNGVLRTTTGLDATRVTGLTLTGINDWGGAGDLTGSWMIQLHDCDGALVTGVNLTSSTEGGGILAEGCDQLQVVGNDLSTRSVGLLVDGVDPVVTDNTAHDCNVGMYVSAETPTIERNSFLGSSVGLEVQDAVDYTFDLSNDLSGTTGKALVLESVTRGIVEDLVLDGGGDAIQLWGSPDAVLRNNTLTHFAFGIAISNSDGVYVHDNVLTDGTVDPSGKGASVELEASSGVVLEDNVFDRSHVGVRVLDCFGDTVLLEGSNSYLDMTGSGVLLYEGFSRCHHSVVRGLTVTGAPGAWAGIDASFMEDMVIEDNVVEGFAKGIRFQWGDNNVVTGNTVRGGEEALVFHASTSATATVQGNRVEGAEVGWAMRLGVSPTDALHIDSSNELHDVDVGMTVTGTAQEPLQVSVDDLGTGPGTGIRVDYAAATQLLTFRDTTICERDIGVDVVFGTVRLQDVEIGGAETGVLLQGLSDGVEGTVIVGPEVPVPLVDLGTANVLTVAAGADLDGDGWGDACPRPLPVETGDTGPALATGTTGTTGTTGATGETGLVPNTGDTSAGMAPGGTASTAATGDTGTDPDPDPGTDVGSTGTGSDDGKGGCGCQSGPSGVHWPLRRRR